jgi:hypothetical protein
MIPYQIYQALIDEHVNELQAAARRHERATEARLAAANRTRRRSRLKDAARHLFALAHVGRGAHARRGAPAVSTSTGSTAGPMGCVA